MRSPKTREKCTGKVRMFFDFVGILPGETMVERSKTFCEKARSGNGSTFRIIVQYLQRLKKSMGKRNKRWN
jgi:hypothetical protein